MIVGVLAGCGTPGVPRPPSLYLPEPVSTLTADRTADTVQLQWTMTRRTTDKLPLQGAVRVRICRALDATACVQVGDMAFAPGSPAVFEDRLPPQLASGPPRLLTYIVQLLSHADHSAGPSNPAYSAAGAAPPALTALGAQVRSDGVLLQWQPAPAATISANASPRTVRIERVLASTEGPSATRPKPPKSALTLELQRKEATPAQQTLTVAELPNAGKALDQDAAFDQTYVYSAQRQQEVTVAGHPVVVAGAASEKISVSTRDSFPPATPSGLVAIAVSEQQAIDLSWTPDTEPDLAGYFVYRRDLTAGSQPERVTAAPIPAPTARDSNVLPGHKYAFSVTAIDADGNESIRSPEVFEILTAP